jgi:glycosyltransferase involved in cell wall biosynthesis
MFVSVEISTFNNKELLAKVLDRLAVQTYPSSKFEVVLSDDGSTDGLPEAVESMRRTLPYSVRLLRNEHRGPANAHNCGIEACKGDVVVMLASDILAAPALLEAHVQAHTENPDDEVVVAGGLVQSPELPATAFQRSWNLLVNRLFSKEKSDLRHGGFFVSNLSFKKRFMTRYGMFCEMPPASQEDLELGYRLRLQGMKLLRSPRALGFHHHPVTLAGVARRSYTQGYHWHFFEEKVPEPWVRSRAGHLSPADGLGLYVGSQVKRALRRLLVNGVTVPRLMTPVIEAAERWGALEPLVPLLAGKVSSYFFYQGLADQEKGLPDRSARIAIGRKSSLTSPD